MIVFVLRHADRKPEPADELTARGRERAELLARTAWYARTWTPVPRAIARCAASHPEVMPAARAQRRCGAPSPLQASAPAARPASSGLFLQGGPAAIRASDATRPASTSGPGAPISSQSKGRRGDLAAQALARVRRPRPSAGCGRRRRRVEGDSRRMGREETGEVRLDGRKTASSSPAELAIHRAGSLRRQLRPNRITTQRL